MKRQIVFWQNAPSMHQGAVIRALAAEHAMNVTVVTGSDLAAARVALGWQQPDYGAARWKHRPRRDEIIDLLARASTADDVHLFSGISAYPAVYEALRHATRMPGFEAHIGIIAEAANGDGLTGFGRRLSYAWQRARFGRRINFLLAMGWTGVEWYRAAGFAADIIFPWGYFVESGQVHPSTMVRRNESFSLLFVGQLVRRKGLDVLLEALRPLRHHDWRLTVAGDGPANDELRSLSRRYSLDRHIDWAGAQPNSAVRELLTHADALVLPSRRDGWGAVTNEALMAGVPVICSDACGSACLVVSPTHGTVVRAGDPRSLRHAIEGRFALGRLHPETRDVLSEWSVRLSGKAAASYIVGVIEHVSGRGDRPDAPWLHGGSLPPRQRPSDRSTTHIPPADRGRDE